MATIGMKPAESQGSTHGDEMIKPYPIDQTSEATLIHEGWDVWTAPTIMLGEQWSYEDKQAMGSRKPLAINKMPQFLAQRLDDLSRAGFDDRGNLIWPR